MPNFSYGDASKNKVQQLLEALLDFANGDLEDSRIQAKLTVKWDKENCKLAVETTLEDLRQLLYGKAKVSPEAKKQQIREIGELLTHYLGEYLQIWEDLRVKKRGSSRWIFSLKLWSQSKEENRQKFREEWQKRQPENSPASPTLSIKVEVDGDDSSRVKRVFGLETIPSIPVWVGRDELVKELTAKLLHQASPPKVLALIGQGGIGKTSLSVKLLEALGVNLQPPSLTKSCIYDKNLYFQVKEGSSFDDVAAFLLKGLGIEMPEPLKTAEEKIGKILQGLTSDRCLLVLDNLEAILQKPSHPEAGRATSPEWGMLLNQLAYSNHRSQVILTSREVPADLADARVDDSEPDPDLVHLQTLTGVEIEDGIELLRQRQLKDKEEDLRWVSHRVEGHVFLLTQLAAIARGKPGYLRKHPELVTKKAEPILQAQLTRQSEAARDLLRRMCVLRVGIDIRGLTFLRLYTDDWEKDYRFEYAAEFEEPAELTDAEIEETQAIVDRLVDSSLVQCGYDEQQCEFFYDLHRLIIEYLQFQCQDELPNMLETGYKFYCTGKNVDNPKTLEDLHPVLEAQYFAFQLGNYSEAANLLMHPIENYLKPWGYWSLLKGLYEQVLPHVDEDDRPREHPGFVNIPKSA